MFSHPLPPPELPKILGPSRDLLEEHHVFTAVDRNFCLARLQILALSHYAATVGCVSAPAGHVSRSSGRRLRQYSWNLIESSGNEIVALKSLVVKLDLP